MSRADFAEGQPGTKQPHLPCARPNVDVTRSNEPKSAAVPGRWLNSPKASPLQAHERRAPGGSLAPKETHPVRTQLVDANRATSTQGVFDCACYTSKSTDGLQIQGCPSSLPPFVVTAQLVSENWGIAQLLTHQRFASSPVSLSSFGLSPDPHVSTIKGVLSSDYTLRKR